MGEHRASRAQGGSSHGDRVTVSETVPLLTAGGVCGCRVLGVVCSSQQVKWLFQAPFVPGLVTPHRTMTVLLREIWH